MNSNQEMARVFMTSIDVQHMSPIQGLGLSASFCPRRYSAHINGIYSGNLMILRSDGAELLQDAMSQLSYPLKTEV